MLLKGFYVCIIPTDKDFCEVKTSNLLCVELFKCIYNLYGDLFAICWCYPLFDCYFLNDYIFAMFNNILYQNGMGEDIMMWAALILVSTAPGREGVTWWSLVLVEVLEVLCLAQELLHIVVEFQQWIESYSFFLELLLNSGVFLQQINRTY